MYEIEKSKDGTIKVKFKEGYHCVIIPSKNNKKTLCISSQIGCAMDCKFCLTGTMGLKRNLNKEEIIKQFEICLEILSDLSKIASKKDNKKKILAKEVITSIVFMGMGEPLANYSNVIESIRFLNEYYFFPMKKITISTSGLIQGMKKLIDDIPNINLAISFHSPRQLVRDMIMPKLKTYSINQISDFSKEYKKKTKKDLMIEYIMIKNLTDLEEDLNLILNLGFPKGTYFNLIPLNGELNLEGIKYKKSNMERIIFFKEELIKNGFKCFIRTTMGDDIEAACGMLK